MHNHLVEATWSDPLLIELANGLLERLPELSDKLSETVREAEEMLGDGTVVPFQDLRDTCHDHLYQAFRAMAGLGAVDFSAPKANGRRRAEQGVPLAAVLHGYRVGARFIWSTLREAADRGGPQTRNALLHNAEWLWLGLDEFSEAVQSSYRDAMAERTIRVQRERDALMDALLSGGATAWEGANALGLPRQGSFCVVVAEVDALGGDRGTTSVWRRSATEEIGVLSLGQAPIPTFTPTGRVGISPVYQRVDGTAEAVRLAKLAQASLEPGANACSHYGDRPLATLIASASDTAAQLAEMVLRAVLALSKEDRGILLKTAWAWCESGGSTSATAAALFCHRNTVRHRLNRVEELTGLSFDDPIAVAELVSALRSLRLTGTSC